MANVLPFGALRFDPSRVKMEEVLTQPYDKITPEMQERYYSASPHNLVRVELGKKNDSDDDQDNVYTRAAAFLKEQRENGVILEESSPSIYAYSQRFEVPGEPGHMMERRGFIAVGKLYDYSDNVVHRHEQTLAKPKADRLELLRKTKLHTGQIFMLYPDSAGEIEKLIYKDCSRQKPDASLTDEYGVEHQLWRIADTAVILQVRDRMRDKKLIIADGHHRYETALAYRNERRADKIASLIKSGRTGQSAVDSSTPFENLMMTFVNIHSNGLLVLPTHRVVAGLANFNAQALIDKITPFFAVEKLKDSSADAVLAALRKAGEKGSALALCAKNKAWLLRAHEEEIDKAAPLANLSAAQRGLDVLRLHKVLLEFGLGITEEAVRQGQHLTYLRNHKDAVDRVQSGDGGAQAAFLMNAVSMDQLESISFAGEVMPQKSTDFYPKLLSGITMQSVE